MTESDRAMVLTHQANRAVQQYTSVNTILWTIFSIFTAANALLASRVVETTGAIGGGVSQSKGVVLSIVGVLISIAWALLLTRTLNHLELARDVVGRVEVALDIHRRLSLFNNEDLADFWLGSGRGPKARHVMVVGTLVAFGGWLGFLFYLCARAR